MRIIDNQDGIADGKIYNIGNPKNNHSVRDLANQMLEIARSIPEYAKTANEVTILETTSGAYYGEGYQDVQNRVPAIDNTMSELGWKPSTTMTDALKNIFEAYREDVEKARHLVDTE
jgi:nucleoside-diphosphate-sugar epimerase